MSLSVAVTGATGFIGRNLIAQLVGQGVVVRAVVRPQSARNVASGASVVRAALEPTALREAFEDVDAVVHLAGVVNALDETEYTAVNVEGTRAVVWAAAAAGVRLVHVSSLAAAGPASASAPRSEDDLPSPRTPYGRSKLDGERLVTAMRGLSWTILRPGVVYGPGDHALLPLFKCARLGLLPLVGRRDAAYMFVHVGRRRQDYAVRLAPTLTRSNISSACMMCSTVCAAEQLARSRHSSGAQPGGTIRLT